MRQTAWYIATARSPGCWPFWRHGFESRWGVRVEKSDYTAVPNYDSIQEQVAAAYPEYAHDESKLWDFLFSPYVPRKRPAELWEEAFRWAVEESQRCVPQGVPDDVPF